MAKHGKKPRLSNGLTVREAEFAKLICQGYTKTDAYVQVFGRGRKEPNQVYTAAWNVANRPRVNARIDELLREAKTDDLMQTHQVIKWLIDGMELAKEAKNYSAYAAMLDRAMRHKALMSDRLVIDAESQLTDEQLIDALAGSNTTLKQQLMTVLHGKSGFDA